jgi:hypothetical protein
MNGRRLGALLRAACEGTDMALAIDEDFQVRFQKLRDAGVLSRNTGKIPRPLSNLEIASSVLALVPAKPGYAGLNAIGLQKLRPVGGTSASFRCRATFGEAISTLLGDAKSADPLVEVRAYTELHGEGRSGGSITFRDGDGERTSHYVSQLAVSLLQPGKEKAFNPRSIRPPAATEVAFSRKFFTRLAFKLQREREYGHLFSPLVEEETDVERQRTERARRLGYGVSSRFMNLGVDTQVTWPKKETLVDFEGKQLVLMPMTKDHTTSIHIDLTRNRLSNEDAMTLANRFLSMLTWCSDQFAINQGGWSGNPVPVAVPRRNLAFATAYDWIFDRKLPASEEARRALALYREARTAEQTHMVPYAVLGYYKIIELKHLARADAIKWFRLNYTALKDAGQHADIVARFETARGSEHAHDYLYRACRTAVAHANKPRSTDPDSLPELRRLHVAADILRVLARLFISRELGVSDNMFDGS